VIFVLGDVTMINKVPNAETSEIYAKATSERGAGTMNSALPAVGIKMLVAVVTFPPEVTKGGLRLDGERVFGGRLGAWPGKARIRESIAQRSRRSQRED
jgi:hypothetical protein